MALYREGTRSISGISGPLLFVSNARKAALGELVAIETNRGRLYDPQVVDACLRLFRKKNFHFPGP